MQLERDTVEVAERRVVWSPWSPAQLVALIVGIVFVVLGGMALAKAGINADTFTSTHTSVWGVWHTPLLAVVEIVYGLMMIGAGAVPGAGRSTMAVLGVLALGFGIIVLAQPSSLYDTFGTRSENGWLYIVTGAITLIAGIAAPVFFGGSRQTIGAAEYDARLSGHGRI